jgi:cytochrome c-type biogenesis protein CcmH
VLAPIYLRLGRADEAVNARAKVLQLLGPSAAREADLGEALTAAAGGVVNAEARAAFERALALDPENAKAKIFLDFAGKRQGRLGRAKENT